MLLPLVAVPLLWVVLQVSLQSSGISVLIAYMLGWLFVAIGVAGITFLRGLRYFAIFFLTTIFIADIVIAIVVAGIYCLFTYSCVPGA